MIMLQVNTSPEMLVDKFDVRPLAEYINKIAPRPSDEYSCSPNGWMYRKDEMGVLPREVLKVFKQRKSLRKEQLQANENAEKIEMIIRHEDLSNGIDGDLHQFNLAKELTDEDLSILKTWNKKSLTQLEDMCRALAKTKNTGQLNRKILINSAYGAMANKYFRYMDTRNAEAITMFGQLTIQWAERNINNTMNKIVGTKDEKYVFYIDTDSVYVNVEKLVEKIGLSRFKDTNHLVDFLDRFAVEKIEPMLTKAFKELAEYMNNTESYMNMDREVIAMAELGTEGLGAIWTGKKRYALNVFDNEGVRYAEPQLKIMGIETQRSSTPKIVGRGLEEAIRVMLQEGITPLQKFVENYRNKFLLNYRELDYKELAGVSSANNLEKYSDENMMPLSRCPAHVKGALAYNRLVKERNVSTPIREGGKIMWLQLKPSNPYKSDRFSWESGENIPYEFRDVLDYVDYMSILDKHFFPALKRLTDAGGFSYENETTVGFESFENLFF